MQRKLRWSTVALLAVASTMHGVSTLSPPQAQMDR